MGQIRPHDSLVRYEVDVRRYTAMESKGASMVIGSASVLVDGEEIYRIENARVGTFMGISYGDYPHASENSKGGRIER